MMFNIKRSDNHSFNIILNHFWYDLNWYFTKVENVWQAICKLISQSLFTRNLLWISSVKLFHFRYKPHIIVSGADDGKVYVLSPESWSPFIWTYSMETVWIYLNFNLNVYNVLFVYCQDKVGVGTVRGAWIVKLL